MKFLLIKNTLDLFITIFLIFVMMLILTSTVNQCRIKKGKEQYAKQLIKEIREKDQQNRQILMENNRRIRMEQENKYKEKPINKEPHDYNKPSSVNTGDKDYFYYSKKMRCSVIFDDIKLYMEADPHSPVIGILNSSDNVWYLNKKSSQMSIMKIFDKTYQGYWINVITKDGKKGWVFSEAVVNFYNRL